jgi:hypothetical protein
MSGHPFGIFLPPKARRRRPDDQEPFWVHYFSIIVIVLLMVTNNGNAMDQSSCSTSPANNKNPQNHSIGVHGVRLKHFEQVVANVLPTVQPDYMCLPPNLNSLQDDDDWPFSKLPKSARVLGTNPGQLKDPQRAARKEGQLRSMLRCILRLVPNDDKKPFTIVDFGGGSGHLGIPLALLLPQCRIIVVDLRKRSLDLMHEKASFVAQELLAKEQLPREESSGIIPSFVPSNPAFHPCGKDGVLGNLFSYHGPVENYTDTFDMALALHLCGAATDVTLRKAAAVQAAAIVVAPCCVGKLSKKVRNPDVYLATGQNISTVTYPQSLAFCQLIPKENDWDALVKAADYSNEQESRTSRNATRRTAKALLETDRQMFLEDNHQYKTALMRMDPWEVTPKNDILVAWKPESIINMEEVFSKPDLECQADVEVAKSHLLYPLSASQGESSDWTKVEEQAIRQTVQDFLDRTESMQDKMDQVFIFPTRMGGRTRKLIHFVAGQLNLAHWSVGSKDSDKTVAVARRGQRKRKQREE